LFSGLSDFVVKLIEKNVDGFSDITEASPTLVQLITKLPAALLTPVLFVILFFIFRLIIGIILKVSLKPVYKLDPCNLPPLASDATEKQVQKRKGSVSRSLWIGRGISIVPGLVLVFVLFLPIAGYLNMASETMDAIVVATENEAKVQSNVQMLSTTAELDDDPSELKEINDDYIKPVNDNIFIKMVYGVGGKASFNTMTSFKLGEDKVSLSSEIAILSTATSNIMVLTDEPIKEYTKEQTNAITKLTEQFEDSVILPKITSEVLSDASDNWLKNEEFFGIKKPTISSTMDPMFNKALEIFKTETEDTIKDDLNTLADIFVILIDNDVLNSVDNQENLMQALSKEGLITSMLIAITDNDRMAVLTNEITNMGVRAIATTLKIPEDKIAVHQKVVDSIKNDTMDIIKSDSSVEEKVTALAANLDTIFTENGMDVSTEITPILAESIIGSFKDQDEISSDKMNDYFIMLSGVYEEKTQTNTIVNKQTQSPFIYLAYTETPNVILCADTMTLTYEEFLSLYEKNKDKFCYSNFDVV